MGLDMYLFGMKSYWPTTNPDNRRMEDGFEVSEVKLRLGYWRKHPNLHGYIVQAFAEGKDDCKEIPLKDVGIKAIINAVKEKRLPFTEGFFFGASELDDEQIAEDVGIFEKALAWLQGGDESPVIIDAPGSMAEKLNEGLEPVGMQAMSVKLREPQKDEQYVTRRVVYEASW